MRNLLALLSALILIFLGLGWYLGWYKINSTTTPEGHRQISIDLDTNRIKTDVNKMVDRDGSSTTPTSTGTGTPPPKTTPATPTGFRPDDGSFVYPGEPFTPAPPGGGPRLPMPR